MTDDIMSCLKTMKDRTISPDEAPFSKVCQIGIVVENLEKTISYLEEKFGFGPFTRIPQEEGGIGAFDIGNLQIELIENSVMGWKPGSIHLGFFVEDIDKELEQLKEKGVKPLKHDSVGGLVDYAYLDTQKDTDIIFELIKVTT